MALDSYPHISKTVVLGDGTTYACACAPSDKSKPTFLLLHGFPSTSRQWHRIIPSLTAQGYGVIAPDLLGHGDSDQPSDLAAYSYARMADHMAEIVAKEGLQRVIGVGHDVGSTLLSWIALRHASIFQGLVFLVVGYVAPGSFNLAAINSLSGKAFGYPIFGYMVFFNEDGAAEVLDRNPRSVMSLCYPTKPEDWRHTICPFDSARKYIESGRQDPLPAWLTQEEANIQVRTYSKHGYRGPLNLYKSLIRGLDDSISSQLRDEDKKIDIRTVFAPALRDRICRAEGETENAQKWLKNYRIAPLDCGHWPSFEKPDETLEILLGFAEELSG